MVFKIIICSILLVLNLASVIYFLLNLKIVNGRRIDEENSIVVTSPGTSKVLYLVMLISSNVGFILVLIFSIISKIDLLSFFMYLILLLLINGMSLNFFIKYYFDYVKLSEGKFYIKSFLKDERIVEETEVKKSSINQNKIYFGNDNNSTLFYLVYNYQNVDKIISHLYHDLDVDFNENLLNYYKIELKKKEEPSNEQSAETVSLENETPTSESEKIENDKYTSSQVEKYTEIGARFRENEKKNKIIDIVKHCLLQILIIGFVLFFTFYFNNYFLLIILLVNAYLAYSKIKEMRNKYHFEGKNDFDLGLKYAYLDKRVKGYHQNKNKLMKSTLVMIGIFVGIYIIFTGYLLFTSKPIDLSSSSYSLVEGQITSISGNNKSINIKISDSENKYQEHTFQIPSALFNYYDNEAILNEEVNQNIVIKSDLTSSNSTTLALYVKIGDKEYVNQESLTSYYNDYMKKQRNSFIISLSIGLVFVGGSLGYYYYNKAMIKKEEIDLSE